MPRPSFKPSSLTTPVRYIDDREDFYVRLYLSAHPEHADVLSAQTPNVRRMIAAAYHEGSLDGFDRGASLL